MDREDVYVGLTFIHDGRGVRVTSISPDFVQYVTWPEGRGERQMRCWKRWDRWLKKYGIEAGAEATRTAPARRLTR